jgi:hypothetical protein
MIERDSDGWREDHFFPLGYGDKPFRRKPYPDMTVFEALDKASGIMGEMAMWAYPVPPEEVSTYRRMSEGALTVLQQLQIYRLRLETPHEEFPGRSQAIVNQLSNIWRGPVLMLLSWYNTHEGERTK